MVRMPVRMRMLDRKLLRDLWAMKGQALAIATVIAAGVVAVTAPIDGVVLRRLRESEECRARR